MQSQSRTRSVAGRHERTDSQTRCRRICAASSAATTDDDDDDDADDDRVCCSVSR